MATGVSRWSSWARRRRRKPRPSTSGMRRSRMMASGWLSSASAQPGFGADGGTDLIAFETQHPRKRLRHAFIVVDDQDLRGRRLGHDGGHRSIVTDDGSAVSVRRLDAELDRIMLRLRRLIVLYPTIWRRSLSPILVRPVREQLEHDRIIRLLHAQVPPEVRGRDEPRHRAEHAGRHGPDGAVSRPGAACPRTAATSCRSSSKSRPASRSTTSRRWRSGRITAAFARRFTSTCPPAWSTSRGG